MTPDPIVNAVIRRLAERSEQGVREYGTTLADNTADLRAWVEHAQEELMDAVLYLERVRRELGEEGA